MSERASERMNERTNEIQAGTGVNEIKQYTETAKLKNANERRVGRDTVALNAGKEKLVRRISRILRTNRN